MRTRSPRIPRLVLLAAAVACAACGGFSKGKEDADRAVVAFHEQFNQGRYDELWDASGDELKRVAPREEFTKLLAAVRRKLGDVTGSSGRGWNVRSQNGTTYVSLTHETTFATGKASEAFMFVVRDGRATLVGYHISSNDLITR